MTSLVVCINNKIHDIKERNVTIRSEICTTNIRSLELRDTRERVNDIMAVDITELRVYMSSYWLFIRKGGVIVKNM